MRHWTAIGLAALAAGPARAEPTPDPTPDAPAPEDTIVVTGTRIVSPLADSPIAVEVVRRDEIAATRARNAAEVLDHALGLVVTPSFRGSGLEVQGLDARHVLVLIDGERVTGKVDEQLDLSRFPAESIERIEIVKGAGSAVYGSDAIGGVVNIITRKARSRPAATLDLLAGSEQRSEITADGSFRGDDLGTAFAFGFRHEGPYRLDASSPATTASGFDDLSSMLHLDLRVDDALRLDARVQYLYREQHAVDATELPPDLAGHARFRIIDRTEYLHSLQARIAGDLQLAKDHRLELSLSTSLAWSELIEDQRNGAQYDLRQPTTESLVTSALQWVGGLGPHLVTAGAELEQDHLASDRLDGREPSRTRLGLYAEDEWRLLTAPAPAFALVPGVRFDFDSQFGPALTPRLALRFDPVAALTLRLSYGFGYRAPGFRELYLLFENPSVGYRVAGNPDLAPERSRSLELGADLHPSDAVSLVLTAFRHDLDDLIVTLPPVSRPGELDLYTYGNVATATAQGFELRLVGTVDRHLALEAGYGFTDSRDDQTGLRILGRATHQITARIGWHPPCGLDLSLRTMVLGPRPFEVDRDADGVSERVDSRWQVMSDVRVSYALGAHLALSGGVDNLFDVGDPELSPVRPRNVYVDLAGHY